MRTGKIGFTLIELLVVIIIVGILAAIAVPIFSGIQVKAICAEGVITLGVIRNALRMARIEDKNFAPYGYLSDLNNDNMKKLGLTNELQGAYFGKECYFIDPVNILCIPRPDKWGWYHNSAVRADQTAKIEDDPAQDAFLGIQIDNGRIWQSGISRSGYPTYY